MRIIEITGISGVGKSYVLEILRKEQDIILDTEIVKNYLINDIYLFYYFFKNYSSIKNFTLLIKISLELNMTIYYKLNFIRNSIKQIGKNYLFYSKYKDDKTILVDEGISHLYQNIATPKEQNESYIFKLLDELMSNLNFSNEIIIVEASSKTVYNRLKNRGHKRIKNNKEEIALFIENSKKSIEEMKKKFSYTIIDNENRTFKKGNLMYELSRRMIDKLKEQNIKYCHWKSNMLLNDALAGYDDLDLLVDREDINKFETAILSLGFKEASNKNMSFSAIKHFYGYDNESGEILHLHIYYQIKSGPSWIKSMRFDFESYFLDHLTKHESGMPVPEKHIELTLFIFRVMLKYSKINEFIMVKQEQERTIKEIAYLKDGMNEKRLEEFLLKYFSKITLKQFYEYIDVIENGSTYKKYIKGKKVGKQLSDYKYLNFLEENINNIAQFTYRLSNRLFFKKKKSLHSTGALIVVAGLDATGKTTVTHELKKWLGKNFTTSLVHFGKPPSRFRTYPINLLISLVRAIKPSNSLKLSIKKEEGTESFIYIIRQIVIAYDRYTLAKKCLNRVSLGEIVLMDRYKSEDYGVMDSRRLNPKYYNGLKYRLAEFENRLYDTMPKPEILFYLTVPVEVAVTRNEDRIKKGKESEEFIRVRHEQNKDLTYEAKHNYLIDTNQPYEDEIRDIKFKIWSVL
jgi:thymidylate kinase